MNKRLLSILLAVTMMCAIPFTSLAEAYGDEDSNLVIESGAAIDLDTIAKEVATELNAKLEDEAFRTAVHTKGAELIRSFESAGLIRTGAGVVITRAYTFDEAIVESTLCANESVGASALLKAKGYADDAEKAAAAKFTGANDGVWVNAYRHFYWSWLMARNQSESIAKTVGNNHEWARFLTPKANSYFAQRIQFYISGGVSSDDAAIYALSDTTTYVIQLKSTSLAACKKSYSTFKSTYTGDSGVDLANNYYGRAARTYTSIDTAWTNYKSKVVLEWAQSSEETYKLVWDNGWYY